MGQLAEKVATLTNQLNELRPPSEEHVAASQWQVSDAVNSRLELQSQRIDNLNSVVQQSQKTASDNADVLQTLLIGIENLGENFR